MYQAKLNKKIRPEPIQLDECMTEIDGELQPDPLKHLAKAMQLGEQIQAPTKVDSRYHKLVTDCAGLSADELKVLQSAAVEVWTKAGEILQPMDQLIDRTWTL